MDAADPQLLAFIGEIYDSVVDRQRWIGTLENIRRAFAMHNAGMGVSLLPSGQAILQFQVGIPDHYVSTLPQYADAMIEPWGGLAGLGRLPLEEPVVNSRLISHDSPAWTENRYVREWVVPQGIDDAVAVILAFDRSLLGTLTFGRHSSKGPILDTELAAFRVITPHLRRAVVITGLIEEAVSTAATFAAALDATPTGVILVDAELNVVHANASGERMLTVGDPVLVRDGKASLRLELVPGRLEAAVAAASLDDLPGRRGFGIPARTETNKAIVVHVLPLLRRTDLRNISSRAAAALFIAEPATPMQLPSDALSILYELTPAETRVVELLVSGATLPQIAERLGSSTHTVRTHLNRVFDKTGAHRQSDLIRLLSSTTLP